MQKYTIEDNINFYEELNNSDNESCNYENICQITGSPLIDKSVMLECNHSFNYTALYTEICKQKFDFKTYSHNLLTAQDWSKVIHSKLDYFIRCPYCRNIQFTVLPYYPELKLQEHYGVNSLDKMIYKYGVSFKVGKCCHSTYICSEIYVAPNSKSNICYCAPHYVEEIKKQSLDEKQALLKKKEDAIKKKKEDVVKKKEEIAKKKEENAKKKEENAKKKTEDVVKKKEDVVKKKEDAIKKKEDAIKKKEDETTNKLKLLEEMNIARTSIGLKALKCLPRIKIKKVITNV